MNDALPTGARVVKELGDGLLLWFPDVTGALCTTLDLQAAFEDESATGGCRSGCAWVCTAAARS